MSDYYVKTEHDIHKRLASFYDYIHRNRRDIPEDNSDPYELLKEWASEVSNKIPLARKMVLYAGHDSTVANLLLALKVWERQVPGYAITALLEFSRDKESGEFGLEVYLRNSTLEAPHKLTIPGCESFCPLTKLVKLVEPVIPRDLTKECKSHDPNYVPPTQGGP